MKATKLLFAFILALAALVGLTLALTRGQASAARAEGALLAPTAPQALPPPYLSDANAADAPYGASPTVDGRIAPGEYAGAYRLAFPTYGGDLEVFIRQNAITLYIAFDSPDTTAYPTGMGGPGPAFQVFLDTNNSKESSPQPGDYLLSVDKGGNPTESQGDGAGGWGGPANGNWAAATSVATWGWQGEFAIALSKLGITQTGSLSIGLGLAEVWTPSWPHDWYWPAQGFYLDPSTWGNLASSSDWGTFYWKPGPWEDYAPSGLPDFDQMQVGPTYCGPFAAANSLWWFDSKFEQHPVGPLPGGPPSTIPISDSYTLVKPYGPWDDHDPANVVSLTQDLANNYFGTNQGITGTHVYSMYYGIQRYLRDHGLWDDYVVTLVNKPDFFWITEEAMRSEDVVLLLGFWQEQPPGSGYWVRIGGHFVTVAGVDANALLIALSDPAQDAAENPGAHPASRVLSGTLVAHTPIPHTGVYTLHNDAGNVSHDVYAVVPGSLSPGGDWWIPDYETPEELLMLPGMNPNPRWEEPPQPWIPSELVHVEIEYALAVSPYDWKASGRWVEDPGVALYGRRFDPYQDFAPSGVPDFDQKQDNWGRLVPPWQWTFCGPVAAANSLWWFDGKFEPNPTTPPTPNDNYPLVQSYDPAGAWDDHDPLNVDDLATAWPPGGELIEDLARYFNTDGMSSPGIPHAGTIITDMYTGIVQYITAHNLRQGYVITMVNKPEFWWTAEEVEVSEDVILLLGFYADFGGYYERAGGHYVTVPGVDKQGGYVAFSDPYWDRMEMRLPPNEFTGIPVWTGRIGSDGDPLLGPSGLVPTYSHAITHTGVYTLHNDAANVSHDVYHVVATDSPGGIWGPWEYVTNTGQIANFVGQNGGGIAVPPGVPVQTEVEWAVAVSPVADVFITKTVTPAVVRHGERITFTITFSNAGNLAQGVAITDGLPSQLTGSSWSAWVSNGGSITARGGTSYVWDVPDLAWGEWGIITVTGQISATDLNQSVVNTASISTSSVEQYQIVQLANAASASFTIQNSDIGVAPASLSVTLTEGASASRFITISNSGGATLNWSLAEQPSVAWLSETPTSGSTAPSNSAQVVVTFTAGSAGVYTTALRITSDDPEENPVDVPVSLMVNRYGVNLQPPSGSIIENPNKTVTYTLALYNTGNVSDTYAITGAVSGQAWTTNWPSAPIGPLAAGGSAQFDVTVQIPLGASDGDWSRTVITATSQGDGGKQGNSTLTTYAQSGTITHGITVTPISPTVSGDPGSTVCFTLTVTNTGNVTDTVSVTHTFPLSWTVTFTPLPPYMLPPGGSQAVHTCITIPSGAGGGSTETGDVTVRSQGDPAVHTDVNVTVHVGWRFIYLPLVLRNYP